jgi:glutamine synthetase
MKRTFEYIQNCTVEYIWIDSENWLRSKPRVLQKLVEFFSLKDFPDWNFDGSSTGQAEGHDSEITLKPRALFIDPFRDFNSKKKHKFKWSHYLVLCDCYKDDIPIPSNNRYEAAEIFERIKDHGCCFGLEQEYVFTDNITKRVIDWPAKGLPEPQGKYYCGVGADRAYGREIAEEHFHNCVTAEVKICGINGEVFPGQWEFQIGICEGIEAADHLWVARYILIRTAEAFNMNVSFAPKPVPEYNGNGSGLHTNVSTKEMRNENGINYIYQAIQKLGEKHQESLKVFGDNSLRLTGTHETSSCDKFTFGVANRKASIRLTSEVNKNKCGYFEDRRPASDADPYLVTSNIAKTILL